MIYNPDNWYWYVGGDQTQAYSSAGAVYVPAADLTFQAWLAAGNAPTNIDSEASLWNVLAQQFPAGIAASNATGQTTRKTYDLNNADTVAFQVLFNHENRIRTLESKASITVAQFKTALISLLN